MYKYCRSRSVQQIVELRTFISAQRNPIQEHICPTTVVSSNCDDWLVVLRDVSIFVRFVDLDVVLFDIFYGFFFCDFETLEKVYAGFDSNSRL